MRKMNSSRGAPTTATPRPRSKADGIEHFGDFVHLQISEEVAIDHCVRTWALT